MKTKSKRPCPPASSGIATETTVAQPHRRRSPSLFGASYWSTWLLLLLVTLPPDADAQLTFSLPGRWGSGRKRSSSLSPSDPSRFIDVDGIFGQLVAVDRDGGPAEKPLPPETSSSIADDNTRRRYSTDDGERSQRNSYLAFNGQGPDELWEGESSGRSAPRQNREPSTDYAADDLAWMEKVGTEFSQHDFAALLRLYLTFQKASNSVLIRLLMRMNLDWRRICRESKERMSVETMASFCGQHWTRELQEQFH